MFPIIPSHILNGTPSTSIGRVPINSSTTNYTKSFWNVWTEDFLRRKCISATTSVSDASESIEIKHRDHKRSIIKTEIKSNHGSYAIETIPKDTKSRSFDCIDISSEQPINCKSFISIDSTGYLSNDQRLTESIWLKSLTLAYDTYSHNAQLEITNDHRLRVKIVKNLVVDEEIQLWFSDEILAMLSVPFLTPVNILGKFRIYLLLSILSRLFTNI